MTVTDERPTSLPGFRDAYAAHRAAEGRACSRDELLSLPYLATGPLARQWQVRARTFDAFARCVLGRISKGRSAPLDLLDLGAGNGWLCYRAALAGHHTVALDLRDDAVDGLGAAGGYLIDDPVRFHRVVASFDELPFPDRSFDLAVFNASLHYALDLERVLREAARVVRRGGRIAILDSPFYANELQGAAMVAAKRHEPEIRFGARAGVLLGPSFVEFLTEDRLATASSALVLRWRRHRVRYPLWYELRPLMARLRGNRIPSRFDLWEGAVS